MTLLMRDQENIEKGEDMLDVLIEKVYKGSLVQVIPAHLMRSSTSFSGMV